MPARLDRSADQGVAHGMNPRGDTRLIYHADSHPWQSLIPLAPHEEDCHEFVDHIADAGVDILTLMGLVQGEVLWKTDLGAPLLEWSPESSPGRLRLRRLWDQGLEPIDVYARRCRQKGMKFYVKFRMNDRHVHHHNLYGPRFDTRRRKWWLDDEPGGFDYTHPGVRDWMFELAKEVVQKFDIDGLTLNYMRYPYAFEHAESRAKQPILTDFMRRVREMLNEEGKRKGRKLDLCVIVAPTIEECQDFGLGVPTWIEQEIVDSVCPCHFDNTLFNCSYEEFAKLTRGTNVYLYPTVHPGISPYLYYGWYMDSESYRAAARNIYTAGADGISAFNYMCHWTSMLHVYGATSRGPADNYPKAMDYLRILRDAEHLDQGDRHYVYWRNRPMRHMPGFLDRHEVMTLQRTQGVRVEWPLRCAESLADGERAAIRFNAVNLQPDDEIEISVNGQVIDAPGVVRTFHEGGRPDRNDGMPLDAYSTVTFDATAPPLKFVENCLGVTLAKSAPDACGEISLPEIEIGVATGGRSPIEVMDALAGDPPPEPLESLAGYHPDITEMGAGIMRGDVVDPALLGGNEYVGARLVLGDDEVISAGAQSFVLKQTATISRVEVCIGQAPVVAELLRLSVRADSDGVPADDPLCADAVLAFSPWESPEGLTASAFQGYYRFSFEKPLALPPGKYWLVLEMDPSRQPDRSKISGGSPSDAASCYAPILSRSAHKHYSQGVYSNWTGRQWERAETDGRPLSAFFGVFGE